MADLHAIEPEDLAENVVEKIEEVLKLAKAGEISSVAFAIVYRDGRTGGKWSRLPSIGLMLGSISRLAHKLNLGTDSP